MKDVLKNYVDDYNKKFVLYKNIFKWKIHFSDTIINIKSDRLYNIHPDGGNEYCFYNRFEEYNI